MDTMKGETMLKVIVKTINVAAAVYVSYLIGGTIYAMGKEAGKREAAENPMVDGVPDENNDNQVYKFVDGKLYKQVGVE